MPTIVELLMQSELVQLDSQTDVFFETPPPDAISEELSEAAVSGFSDGTAERPLALTDSDSGESLFLMQSVTPAHRTVKRCHSSKRPGTIPRGEPDDQLGDDDLFSSPQKVLPFPEKRAGGSCSKPRKWRPPPHPKRREFPLLQEGSEKLSVHKSHTLMNSEIGGFFKYLYNVNRRSGMKRRELKSFCLLSDSGKGSMEQDHENDHDDIRIVDLDSFISGLHKRNTQKWIPVSRWKRKRSSRIILSKSNTTPKKDNGRKKEKIEDKKKPVNKNSPVSTGAKGKRKTQENTETLEFRSLNVRTLRSHTRKL
ncbi:hypothetical protein MHYP_G00278690 [Metynnis hypsauchen]